MQPKVNDNSFVNPAGHTDLEVEYNDNRNLDATNNYWGSDDLALVTSAPVS